MQMQRRVRAGFNFLAPFYDFFSFLFFGNSILNSQTFLLQELKKCKNVLVLGGGSGKLLMELIKRDVAEQCCYVDISNKMIALAKKRLEKEFSKKIKSVNFICGSVNDIDEKQKFDLIITPYILDCITQENLSPILQQLKSHLLPNGKWLFIDFNIPKNSNAKPFSFARVRIMYFGFNIICGLGIKQLPDFEKEFLKLNFLAEHENYFLREFQVARIYKKTEG